MASGIEAAKESISEQIAGFQPQSRDDVHQFFTGLPDLIRTLGQALGSAADNMADEHIHASVLDSLHELAAAIGGMADTADDTVSSHLSNHSLWLDD